VDWNGTSVSYAEFHACILATRDRLARLNLPKAPVAAVMIGHLFEAWVVTLALQSLGYFTVPIDNIAQLDRCDGIGLGLLVRRGGETPAPLPDRWIGRIVEVRLAPLSKASVDQALVASTPPLDASGGHILMTSGTTGVYKLLKIDVKAQRVRIRNLIEIYGTTADTVAFIGSLRLFSGAGFNRPLRTWAAGGQVVLDQANEVSPWFKVTGLTDAVLTPICLTKLLAAPDAVTFNPALHLYIVAGALPWHQAQAVMQRLTPNVYTELGSTETGTVAVTRVLSPGDQLAHRIHPSRHVEVVNDEDEVLPPGEIGAVRIRRRPDDVDRYLGDPEATRTFFRGAFFHPGDLGLIRTDGRLELHGRATDVISVQGAKIAAFPIEQAVQERLKAKAVCVFSAVNADGEEDVYVVVEAGARLDAASRRGIVDVLPPGKCLLVTAPVFPRNRMGKVDRRALRAMILRDRLS
jgi:acyl-coenzyme A synthetase/AMP-(fatty) acid ligase